MMHEFFLTVIPALDLFTLICFLIVFMPIYIVVIVYFNYIVDYFNILYYN